MNGKRLLAFLLATVLLALPLGAMAQFPDDLFVQPTVDSSMWRIQSGYNNETTYFGDNSAWLKTSLGAKGEMIIKPNIIFAQCAPVMTGTYPAGYARQSLNLSKDCYLHVDLTYVGPGGWNVFLIVNGSRTLPLTDVITRASGQAALKSIYHDGRAGTFKGTINLNGYLNMVPVDGVTPYGNYAVDYPMIQLNNAGNGSQLTIRELFFSDSANDTPDQPSSWAKDEVNKAIAKGIVPADLQYRYTKPISRLNFCRLAVKYLEVKTGKKIDAVVRGYAGALSDVSFTDCKNQQVVTTARLKIVSGVGKNKFAPNNNITRAEAAKILSQVCVVLGDKVPGAKTIPFKDAAVAPSWSYSYISFVKAKGVMNGKSGGKFDPLGTFTMEEALLTFVRML